MCVRVVHTLTDEVGVSRGSEEAHTGLTLTGFG